MSIERVRKDPWATIAIALVVTAAAAVICDNKRIRWPTLNLSLDLSRIVPMGTA